MKRRPYRICSALLLASMTAIPVVGHADPTPPVQEEMHDPASMGGVGRQDAVPRRDRSGGRDWEGLLSPEQKAEIDWITLRTSPQQQLLKAQIDVKEAELNQLILGEDVTQDQWYAKIDELLQLKREYMINRYQRMIEVRQVLNPQQRVVFDLDVLSRH
ncbi:MAG: hypothetical protein IPM20_03995 [Gammaproteobacteria bacterium]|nr:hypothetical protein [Gammaproteobacteria bacterium]